ncbi:MAG: hypothetical protein QOK10_1999 [Pseudonocardiales bacterium]|jgi:hypothetical protein|nr:hypothetical protein [Pseudonocardiales bacterium]
MVFGPLANTPNLMAERMDTTEMVQLAQEFADLGNEIHGDGDNAEALRRLVELAVKYVDGCSWASITIIRGNSGHSLASSDDVAARIDAIQYEVGEGPCLQAADDESNYLAFDLATEPRWPEFARRAAEETPLRSVLAFQFTNRYPAALNLYADQVGAFDDDAINVSTILAAHASTLIALSESVDQATSLETALDSNREIGVAIGVLMAHRKITREAAFDELRRASQTLHRKLRDIAVDVVETGTLPDLPEVDTPRVGAN